jgi:indole-3-glycerol phosphate synthase
MPATLDQIVAAARKRASEARSSGDLRRLEKSAGEHKPRGFRARLEKTAASGTAVITELKKASPSRGVIRSDFDVTKLAAELESAGASALSVLTDEDFFQGSLANLQRASAATRLPCLRKDFIVDEVQLLEARANGADAVLLIVAALSEDELVTLSRKSQQLELDVLCEAHDEQELRRALDAGCEIIGVNSRDLRTFHVDLDTPQRLAPLIPSSIFRVAESGIHSGEDIRRLRDAGYQAFLVGESLMKAPHPGAALSELLASGARNVQHTVRSAR